MGQYDTQKKLIIPANIAKLFISSPIPSQLGKVLTLGGPGNEGIDLGVWIEERINDGTITVTAPDISDLITLTGLPSGSVDLGTFTGSIISDNTTIVNALQELETYIESITSGNGIYGGDGDIPNNTVATQDGSFSIDTTGRIGYLLKLGGVTGSSTNRYGVEISADEVLIGNVFGTQAQGRITLSSSGIDMSGSNLGNFVLNATGGGELSIMSDFIITDGNNLGGIKYFADYSANFTNRSLVDKQYVDDAVSTGFTIYTGSGLIGDGTSGDPLDWAGGFSTAPITGSGTSFFPFTIANNSITTNHIQTGTILFADWNQNSASSGQVPQWNGSAWVASSITGTLPSGSSGAELIHNGTTWVSSNPMTETQSGLTGTSVTLASSPLNYARFNLFKNGQYLIVSDDYTRTGTLITLTHALISTDKITAQYYI
jgi:hypothetical protein